MTGPTPDRPWRLTPGCGCLFLLGAVLLTAFALLIAATVSVKWW